MYEFLRRHWFLISLIIVLIVGIVFAEPLEGIAKVERVRNLIVMATLFVVMLPMHGSELRRGVRRPWPAILASLISLVGLPLLAWGVMPILSPAFALGLVVVAATPGTVASAAVWTRRANGNEVVAILVTVITNLLCFVVTPFWLWIIARQASAEISFVDVSIKLLIFVVLPMVAGQLVRSRPEIASWADNHRPLLSIIAQCGILSIVLVGAVQIGLELRRGDAANGSIPSFAWLVVVLLALYSITFWLSYFLARGTGVDRPDAIGVAFSGSQKTLMVGLQIAFYIGGGLLIIPMVTYHFLQLVVGTLFADRLRSTKHTTVPTSTENDLARTS